MKVCGAELVILFDAGERRVEQHEDVVVFEEGVAHEPEADLVLAVVGQGGGSARNSITP